jgi:hypothetical protein
MSGRRIRNLVLLALVAGIAWWVYRDRPTLSGIVDKLTSPLLGSRAAVKSSERNRVVGDATTVISEQVELPVDSVKEGMWGREVRELLGNPDKTQQEMRELVTRTTWTYTRAARVIVLEDDRVVSISVLR